MAVQSQANGINAAEQPEAAQSSPQPWDEIRHAAALTLLDTLQNELIDLRCSVPGLVRPLASASRTAMPTPHDLTTAFEDSARSATRRMHDFRTHWEGSDLSAVLARVRERSGGDGADDGWEVVLGRPRWAVEGTAASASSAGTGGA